MSTMGVVFSMFDNRLEVRRENRVLANQRGQITVMLSLLLTVILLFLLVCSEGVFLCLSKSRMSRNMITAGESALADYDPFLWEKYHLFALDQTYSGMDEDALTVKLQGYFMQQVQGCQGIAGLYSASLQELSVEQTLLYYDDMEILKNQIREYMKYETVQEGWEQLNSFWNRNTLEEVDAAKSDVIRAKQQEESKTEQNNEMVSETNAVKKRENTDGQTEHTDSNAQLKQTLDRQQDPRDGLKQALKLGVVELVTGRSDLSKESYDLQHLEQNMKVAKESGQKEGAVSFSSADEIVERLSVLDYFNQWESELSTEALALSYAAAHFSNLNQGADATTDNVDTACMQCQYEYLIAGKNSDYANAKAVINRLIALRFPLNYIYVIKQPEHVASAQALAVELVGASLNPAAVEVAAYLLLACESYAEAILDVRDLVHGGSVPLKKTKQSWHVNLMSLTSMLSGGADSAGQVDSGEGLSYEEYLKLLLAVMPDKEQKYRRMICVMDFEGKKQNPDFDMSNMIAGFYLKLELQLEPVFCGGTDGFLQDSTTFHYEKMFSY